MSFQFRCNSCDEIHEGIPTFGSDLPALAEWIPAEERAKRVDLGSDDCVIDGERFLIRGCIEIPVLGEEQPFAWGAWADISEKDYEQWIKAFHLDEREHIGPFAGYLGSRLRCYPDTSNHHVLVHLRNDGIRPLLEVRPSEHPLHAEQCQGISPEHLAEICEQVMHGYESF